MSLRDTINLYRPLKEQCNTKDEILAKMVELKVPIADALLVLTHVFDLNAREAKELLFSAKEYGYLKQVSEDWTDMFFKAGGDEIIADEMTAIYKDHVIHDSFWLYSKQKLLDLMPLFREIFETDNFLHDYENVWEWMQGKSKFLNRDVNISREHNGDNGETGNYDKPVIISFISNKVLKDDTISAVGNKLLEKLKTTIYWGEAYIGADDEYVLNEKRAFN